MVLENISSLLFAENIKRAASEEAAWVVEDVG